ncbi:unnamed protein product [Rotaria sp. Silwood2]|nr:unnamed protein product [Rotaria sp. Silwood2]CAF3189666.1 unnamed protein product [Rotaria sp. Silwood2]CAF3481340.1 unnamed protein product [Rotaria sp. Silwood2]CAF4554032.1 unnamed protein product [Rotaria sp. Silwood2]CAF4563348.1 unnamed protein product [Rotaria sp. Silwood2]
MAVALTTVLAVLVVIAHPDDEILFGGFIHALTHKLNASVDLLCVTNGEGGYAHAGASESFGRIAGIRKYFFYDQFDLKSTRDINQIFTEQWNKESVIEQFQRTIKTGNGADGYDIMLIMLPNVNSHDHHTASGLLALEVIKRLQANQSPNITIPTVIGGSECVLTQPPNYAADPLAQVLTNVMTPFEFRFNLKWKVSNSRFVDYQAIFFWMAAEHKTQGGLINEILSEHDRINEQYFYFAINEASGHNARLTIIQNLFTQLANIHQN